MRLLICLLLLVGCVSTTKVELPEVPVEVKLKDVDSVFIPLPNVIPELSWEKGHPERKAWSTLLLRSIDQEYFSAFDAAGDSKRFCPKYKTLSHIQRVVVWSELIVKTAYYESGFNPKTHYHEPPPLGYDSIGLLQLSYEDTAYKCAMNRAMKSLENPVSNLACGVKIMAKLISKYAAVSTSGNKGAAAYWSVLREGHKINQIAAHTQGLPFCR